MKKTSAAYSILVVDDEPELCDAVATAFELKGHSVKRASNGKKALEVVKETTLDLVLSDVRMNECDGVSLLGFIKDMSVNRPIVALMTGYADVTRDEMYDLGAEAVFEKPFKVMELIRQLTNSLDSKDNKWSEKTNVLSVLNMRYEGLMESDCKIGRGGFALHFKDAEPRVAQVLDFEIELKGKPSKLAGQGIVRWVKSDWCGIEFLYLEEPMRSTILKMIENLKPRTFIPKV